MTENNLIKKGTTYRELNNMLNRPEEGSIPLYRDKESVKAYFNEEVDVNMVFYEDLQDKLNRLVHEEYIEEEFLNQYTFEEIESIYDNLKSQKFRFNSFMGAYSFYEKYAMKTRDGSRWIERLEDRIMFTALYLANGDYQLAYDLADDILNRRFQPATPTMLNSGKKSRGELVSCFLIQATDDMNSIGRTINSALQLSRIGGGVGISLTNLREAGAPIKGFENAGSGIIPVMKLFEDSFSYSNQLGQRNGAGAVYIDVFHPDIEMFLSTKKENADEKIRVKTLSLGLTIPDKFYELCEKNETMYLFSPYDVERIYGKPFAYIDITAEYDNMVNNPKIKKKKVKARHIENEISKLQQESGYPYIVNIDTANRENPIEGKIVMSNLCVTGDSELLTDNGYYTAKELYEMGENLKVQIDNRTKNYDSKELGTELVDAIPMQLTKKSAKVFKIKTKQGFELKSTDWHKYYVMKKDKSIVKLPLNELNVGDKLLVQSEQNISFGSNDNWELGRKLGVLFNNQIDLDKLPLYVRQGSKRVIESFLNEIVTNNTLVTENSIQIHIEKSSFELIQQVQMLFLSLGIFTEIQFIKDNKYFLEINQEKSLDVFTVTFRDFFEVSISLKETNEEYTAEISSIEYYGIEDVYDTTQEDYHSLIFNGIVTGNCSEILQVQEVSKVNDEQIYEEEGMDISCNLGSTNIEGMMNSGKEFGNSIKRMVKALTFVTDSTSITTVPSVRAGNEKAHTIGLGAMGLHTFLAKNHIHYGSVEGLDFTNMYFNLLNYWSLVESNSIAFERGKTFHNFDNSKYATGEYFKKYIENTPTIETDKVKELFKDIFIPTTEDWYKLREDVMEYGLYHQNRLAVAPTGSISYVNETSSSIHPITTLIEERKEKKLGNVYYPAPYLSNETIPYYTSAYDMDMRKVIDTYAVAQQHIDQGMSLTLFLRKNDIPEGIYPWKPEGGKQTTRDLNMLRLYAWHKGIKSIYYIRSFAEDDIEIGSNSCESCTI